MEDKNISNFEKFTKGIGDKIQVFGYILMMLELVISIVVGICTMGSNGMGIIILIVGVLGSFISGLMICGYGKIVECQEEIEITLREIRQQIKNQ